MRVLLFAGQQACPQPVEAALATMACQVVHAHSRAQALTMARIGMHASKAGNMAGPAASNSNAGNTGLQGFDAVLLGPDSSGDICSMVREFRRHLPDTALVVVLAARSFAEQIEALAGGADDVVSAETDMAEIAMRVRARAEHGGLGLRGPHDELRVGNTVLPATGLNLVVNGLHMHMPRQQFLLVTRMMQRMDSLLTYASMAALIWPERMERTLDDKSMRHIQVLLTYIRKHLRECDSDLVLETVHGAGIWAMDRTRSVAMSASLPAAATLSQRPTGLQPGADGRPGQSGTVEDLA